MLAVVAKCIQISVNWLSGYPRCAFASFLTCIFDAGVSQQLLQEPDKRYHQRHERRTANTA